MTVIICDARDDFRLSRAFFLQKVVGYNYSEIEDRRDSQITAVFS